MKTFKLLLSLWIVLIISSCNLPDRNPATGQTPTPTAIMATQPVYSTQTSISNTPTGSIPVVTASPTPALLEPDAPAWSAYNYTCDLAVGGGNMTMNLAWLDRSTSEDGYKIYRDGQVVATLAPNSTFYVDIAFVAAGSTRVYFVEAFNENWEKSTSVIAYGCQ